MKIEQHTIPTETIAAFARRHNLTMEVHERDTPVGAPDRYYAYFKGVEAREGHCVLAGVYGNGSTPEQAIADYAARLSMHRLVVDAMGDSRREIKAPRLF